MSHVVSKGLTLSPSVRAAYAKCFVCLWFRVGAQRFVIDRSSVQVRSSAPLSFCASCTWPPFGRPSFLSLSRLWGFCGDFLTSPSGYADQSHPGSRPNQDAGRFALSSSPRAPSHQPLRTRFQSLQRLTLQMRAAHHKASKIQAVMPIVLPHETA